MLVLENWNIFDLPIDDNSVDEVRADCLFEHLDFKEESKIFSAQIFMFKNKIVLIKIF